MVRLIECGLSSGAHEAMKKRLCSLISEKKRAYLIVPEQQTVIVEGEMARELPESAPLYFEVTNFTRLTDSVFRTLGGVARAHIDPARRALFMWRTLTELSPTLDMTRGWADVSDGLVKRLSVRLPSLNQAQ